MFEYAMMTVILVMLGTMGVVARIQVNEKES